ncbi:MAG: YfcE family phosphodiesterase [Anaerolineae bacterium]|nr:YfcE family phosphodiesterase [Anaerolineae bacterium]
MTVIGILSDTHNHAANTKIALAAFRERGITQVIHCGDITTPEIVMLFNGFQVTFVFGNMDSSWSHLIDAAHAIGANRPQLSRDVEIDGKWIGVTHGADRGLLLRITMSGKYAHLCQGHTHRRQDEFNSTYGVHLINPGALGGNKPETRSVCVLDVAAGELEFIEFPELT